MVLPAPFGPSIPIISPRSDSEADVIDGAKFSERLGSNFQLLPHRITCLLRECAFSFVRETGTATECMHPWPSEAFLSYAIESMIPNVADNTTTGILPALSIFTIHLWRAFL